MAKLKFLVVICCLISFCAGMNAQDLQQVRKLFFLTGKDPTYLQSYLKASSKTHGDPLLLAYKGLAIAMKSREIWNPYEKYRNFISGKDSLEKAIEMIPECFEVHFLRFEFQNNLPLFLSYDNKQMDEREMNVLLETFAHQNSDKEFVIKVLNCLDKEKNIHLSNLKACISEMSHRSN